MNADWVAASVRARSLALRRAGAGRCRTLASQRGLADALALLAGTTYGDRTSGCTALAEAQHATRATVLWQLRVLAGWLPSSGTRLVRAAAGAFERDNIVALARRVDGAGPGVPFELGALATAWPQLRTAGTPAQLAEALRRSPWGDPGSSLTALPDVLTLVWLRRLADVGPPARPWAEAATALTGARMLLVDRADPAPRFRALARPVLGRAWETATDLTGLRAALPRAARAALDGATAPEDLWRAEARLRATVEADGFGLLRSPRPGPDVVLGGVAVLAMDAWRVRAALAAAAVGAGSSEVLDAVA